MKKVILIMFVFQFSYAFSQEIYTPGCIYEEFKPIPVYWVNNEIVILGKPINSFGEATSIIKIDNKILVFGYLIFNNTSTKIPVVWEDNLSFKLLLTFYESWFYDCVVTKAYNIDNSIYILGLLTGINGTISTILWDQSFNATIFQDVNILDMEKYNENIIMVGYKQEVGSFRKQPVYYVIEKSSFRGYRIIRSNKFEEIFTDNEGIINIVREINGEIYLGGIIRNRSVVIKNNEILFLDESNEESIICDIMSVNNNIYFISKIKNNDENILLYGVNNFPDIEITRNLLFLSIEMVGLRNNIPVIISSDLNGQKKEFRIIIDKEIISLGF
jgi:hypothetical protein